MVLKIPTTSDNRLCDMEFGFVMISSLRVEEKPRSCTTFYLGLHKQRFWTASKVNTYVQICIYVLKPPTNAKIYTETGN